MILAGPFGLHLLPNALTRLQRFAANNDKIALAERAKGADLLGFLSSIGRNGLVVPTYPVDARKCH